jgi:transcriptional regulator with XRE-family HTH domain
MGIEPKKAARAFGDVLRDTREAGGISQEEIARKAKLNRTFISFLERGLRQPSLATMFALAGALQIRVSRLVAEVEQRLESYRVLPQSKKARPSPQPRS